MSTPSSASGPHPRNGSHGRSATGARPARVVIVGAGPGGAAAAVRLAQRGITDVILVDKDEFPRDKTCGSALSPNGLRLVDELGIGDDVQRLAYPIKAAVFRTPGRRDMKLPSEGAAVVLLRKHFDNLLVERAKALGVEFRGGVRVSELVKEGGRAVAVRGKQGQTPLEIRADYVLCADGAHSIFSSDPRPKRTISTLMGWWEDYDFEPHTMEMIFDKNLSPLYGWMFPESDTRINIGICMDGEDSHGKKTTRNVREVFQQFLDDHYGDRLRRARQIGKLKGHPISYTTWIGHCTEPGMLYLGEGARITHNATGEGIYQAMQSGCYAAEALADVVSGAATEQEAFSRYVWRCRRRFTAGFLVGHALRAALKTPLLDGIAMAYNSPRVRRVATWAIGSAFAGSNIEKNLDGTAAARPGPAAARAPVAAAH